MAAIPFVEGNASEYYLVEDYDSEVAPDSNLVEPVYYDALSDVFIDEYVPVHAAPTIEAETAMEQSIVVEAVEVGATLEAEIAVEEEDTMSEWSEEEDEDVTSESSEETWIESEEDEDVTSESSEETWNESEEDEDVTSESSEETWIESEEDEDMISEESEEASEDEAWVAGEEGLTIQDSAEANAPLEEETWLAGEEETIEDSAQLHAYSPFEEETCLAYARFEEVTCLAYSRFEEETWLAGEGVMIEDSAGLHFPIEVETSDAIEESAEEAVEAITTMITIPAATSTSLIPMWSSTLAVIE